MPFSTVAADQVIDPDWANAILAEALGGACSFIILFENSEPLNLNASVEGIT